jgi:hypothetical protein
VGWKYCQNRDTNNTKRVLVGKPSENVHMEEAEGDWKITLRRIL